MGSNHSSNIRKDNNKRTMSRPCGRYRNRFSLTNTFQESLRFSNAEDDFGLRQTFTWSPIGQKMKSLMARAGGFWCRLFALMGTSSVIHCTDVNHFHLYPWKSDTQHTVQGLGLERDGLGFVWSDSSVMWNRFQLSTSSGSTLLTSTSQHSED